MRRSKITFELDSRRTDHYFGKYQYKASFDVKGVGYFRYIKSYDRFESLIDETHIRVSNPIARSHRPITLREQLEPTLDVIKEFVLWRQWADSEDRDFRVNVTHNNVIVYANDAALLESLRDSFRGQVALSYYQTERIANMQTDTIYQLEPKHSYRVYFVDNRMSNEDFIRLIEFLEQHGFTPCRSLLRDYRELVDDDRLYRSNFTKVERSHHVDYDDERMITVLMLMFPGIVRKVYRIERRQR